MKAAVAEVALGFTEDTLPRGSHVCFYYANEGVLKRSLDFLRIGLDAPKEFCVLFADESRSPSLLGWLQEGYRGDVQAVIRQGKLATIGGAPTLDALVESIQPRLERAVRQDGFELIRFLGFIGWGLPGWPDERTLLEFESQVNAVVTAYPAVIICTYGVPKLPGASLIYGGLQAHPITMLGTRIVRENPFYVEPAAYLKELDRNH